ncbi:MAG: hypothetical protein CW338_02320 [Clostridiales bacterium]|nr:hypothetical protein [Clostridiales bacterium]
MFDDIGNKIMNLTKIVCTILIVLNCIAGLVGFIGCLISGSVGAAFICLLGGVIGCLFAWISGFLMYGLGQLIDDTHAIRMRDVMYGSTNRDDHVSITPAGGNSAAAKTPPQAAASGRRPQQTAEAGQKIQQAILPVVQKQSREEIYSSCHEPGKSITFGSYPQNTTDKDPVEWLVLDYDAASKRTLLISRYALDCKPYNGSAESVTWETSAVRKWLNTAFLNEVFNADEQREILSANVNNGQDQGFTEYDTSGGNDTEDKVFLLSYAEIMKYFGNSKNCMCVPTPHAIGHGAYVSSENMLNGKAACWWWLRSPGSSAASASIVGSNGKCYSRVATYNSFTVRPAFWLELPDN